MLIGLIAVVLLIILGISQWKQSKEEDFEDRDS